MDALKWLEKSIGRKKSIWDTYCYGWSKSLQDILIWVLFLSFGKEDTFGAVFIPAAGKVNHSSIWDYIPISLSSFLLDAGENGRYL